MIWEIFRRAEVDLFASEDNSQWPIFFSREQDALAQDWPKAFEVATNWAHKNYQTRISQETFEQTEKIIQSEMPGSSGCKATETSRAPTYAEVVTQGEPSSRTTTSVSTATTPLLVAHTTSSRVTEYHAGGCIS